MHTEMFLEKFKVAAGEAALCELRLRLLAGKVPALVDCALNPKSFEVEKRVKDHFKEVLSEEDLQLIEKSRQLRNKLLHGDFQQARQKLQELGRPQRSGGVRRINFDRGAEAAGMVKALAEGLSGERGQLVADSASTQEGTVYGWLLEVASSGDLREANDIFDRMTVLLNRLLEVADSGQ